MRESNLGFMSPTTDLKFVGAKFKTFFFLSLDQHHTLLITFKS